MMDVIKDHKLDIDYENPRDFIDVYLTHMRENADSSFNDEQLVVVCLDLIEAGMITTSTTLLWSVLYMALYPEIQKRCQVEIEEKIGSRPPTTGWSFWSRNTVCCLYKLLIPGGAATCSEGFVLLFSESSPSCWAVLQLPCCPNKQGEL